MVHHSTLTDASNKDIAWNKLIQLWKPVVKPDASFKHGTHFRMPNVDAKQARTNATADIRAQILAELKQAHDEEVKNLTLIIDEEKEEVAKIDEGIKKRIDIKSAKQAEIDAKAAELSELAEKTVDVTLSEVNALLKKKAPEVKIKAAEIAKSRLEVDEAQGTETEDISADSFLADDFQREKFAEIVKALKTEQGLAALRSGEVIRQINSLIKQREERAGECLSF